MSSRYALICVVGDRSTLIYVIGDESAPICVACVGSCRRRRDNGLHNDGEEQG